MVTPGQSPAEKSGSAPGRLELVRAFVNTLDIEAGTDLLSSPAGLTAWLAANGLASAPATASAADLRRAASLREALRGVLRAHATTHAGHAPDRAADRASPVDDLRAAAMDLSARLEVGEDGSVSTTADGSGPVAGLTQILLIAAEASTLGTWPRLKACSADDCQWAFYDRSPTRNGCWCSMAVCGSRAKSRAYRRRRQPPASSS